MRRLKDYIHYLLEKFSGYHDECICNDPKFTHAFIDGRPVFYYGDKKYDIPTDINEGEAE